jgi:hypothetical protein
MPLSFKAFLLESKSSVFPKNEIYITYSKRDNNDPYYPNWTWVTQGYDDGKMRVIDSTSYKTEKALLAAIDTFETYSVMKRFKIST